MSFFIFMVCAKQVPDISMIQKAKKRGKCRRLLVGIGSFMLIFIFIGIKVQHFLVYGSVPISPFFPGLPHCFPGSHKVPLCGYHMARVLRRLCQDTSPERPETSPGQDERQDPGG